MGIFSKKGGKNNQDFEGLPDLPQLPKNIVSQNPPLGPLKNVPKPDFDDSDKKDKKDLGGVHSLPSLPKSESANRWGMQAVKDAVKENFDNSYEDSELDDQLVSSGEKEVDLPGLPSQSAELEGDFSEKMPDFSEPKPVSSKALKEPGKKGLGEEPIFVRIDKFEKAMDSFSDIKSRVKSMGELISEIKEIRQAEDEEFAEWEKGIQLVRSKLDNIDQMLFSKLD